MEKRLCCEQGKAYYNLEHDNFYCDTCNRGMGQEFYLKNILRCWELYQKDKSGGEEGVGE